MASGLILIVAVIFFVIVLAIFSNLQTRMTKLQLQIQALQKRINQLPLHGQDLISTPFVENVAATTDPIKSLDVEELERATPVQQIPEIASNLTPSPNQVTAPEKETKQDTISTSTSRFKPITAEEREQNRIKHTKVRDENSLTFRFWRWLINGNPVAKVAIVILFFGLSYLLKYSIDHGLLSPEIRILSSLLLGLALLTLGWMLRKKKELYALILQGGSIGVLYFTLFAAFKLYALVPLLLTFALLVVVCATSIVFAILQRAISLAVIACAGGFLAPILLSTGGGHHIALFSYYLLISSAILIISFWQSWRILNLIGFVFTFMVAVLWGQRSFNSEFYFECQIFILANMIIYGVLAALLSVRNTKKEAYQNLFDLILLFSVPLAAFSLQYAITKSWEFAPAFSALGFGLFYLFGSFIVLKIWQGKAKQIAIYGLAIGLGFSTLAVPLALTANWTALVWLIEGAIITYIALSHKQHRLAWVGALIVILGIISAIIANKIHIDSISFITLYGITSGLVLLNACLWHHYRSVSATAEPLKLLFVVIAIIAWSVWIIGSTYRLCDQTSYAIQPIIACFVISVWIWFIIGRKINWLLLRFAVIALWPVLLLSLTHNILFYLHTSYAGIWGISWLAAFVSGYYYLYFDKQHLSQYKRLNSVLHISLLWLIFGWLFYETHWLLSFLPWGFAVIKWTVLTVVAGLIVLIFFILQQHRCFPMQEHKALYWKIGLLPIGLYLLLSLIIGLYSSGQIVYWTYVPLLNPLEEGSIFALIMMTLWLSSAIKASSSNLVGQKTQKHALFALILMIVLIFLWANSMILRSLSQWLDISWSFYALWHNNVVQIVLSLVWTLTAVILIAIANHFSLRNTWFVGAGLQAIVVIKLVFVDSVELDGLMRAFVFIGVALLMLVIGYLAPLPPKVKTIKTPLEGAL